MIIKRSTSLNEASYSTIEYQKSLDSYLVVVWDYLVRIHDLSINWTQETQVS